MGGDPPIGSFHSPLLTLDAVIDGATFPPFAWIFASAVLVESSGARRREFAIGALKKRQS
jgi:hypothetical protein